ncbi:IS3 family transposase [Salmonella enterica]|nr:IS3 family transposase [Salmonella enterica]
MQTERGGAGELVARSDRANQRLAIKSGARTAALELLTCKIILTQRTSWCAYECYYLNEYKNVDDLKRDIIGYIDYYNQLRIKEKLGGLSPVQYRLSQAA